MALRSKCSFPITPPFRFEILPTEYHRFPPLAIIFLRGVIPDSRFSAATALRRKKRQPWKTRPGELVRPWRIIRVSFSQERMQYLAEPLPRKFLESPMKSAH